MAAYHELTTIQISSILVIELANDNYEIVGGNTSFFLAGNDLTNYLNNLSPSVKVTYQFLEDFS
jgi:adenosine/AMP kinase